VQRILVVDDDRVQVDVVSFLLRRAGFESTAAFDAATAARLFDDQQPDLVILDVHLGASDGRDLLRRFRKQRPDVRILMLTALGAEDERVRGLELGADDYLSKPFGPRELIARVQAMLRRGSIKSHEPVPPRRMQLGSVMLDPMTHEVTRAGQRLTLSPTEFRLLRSLMASPNVLVPTGTLLKEVWGHQDMTARNVLRVTASRLRAKLENDRSSPRLLHTVAGQGLVFREDTSALAATPAPNDAPVALDVVAELRELADEPGMPPLRQLYQRFGITVTEHMSVLRTALRNRDAAALSQEAHRLRGSSGTLGAQRVMRVCAKIEERSRAADLAQVEELLQQLEQELAVFEAAITPLLGPAG
jgi:DNA-binding response OmpR family regulator/HPt (histidine-containing phosphotransfer) domain-containing protein